MHLKASIGLISFYAHQLEHNDYNFFFFSQSQTMDEMKSKLGSSMISI